MNKLRRFSCVDHNAAMPVIDTNLDEKPRHRHRHHHHLPHHRSSHDRSPTYAVSPLGGNRPFSVHEPTKVTARTSVDSVAPEQKSRSRRSSISLVSSSSSDNVRSEKPFGHRHRSHSLKASRHFKKSRDVESDPEDSAAARNKEVQAPETYTLPRMRTKTTPTMGSVFPEQQQQQQRRRAGTVDGSAPPHITQTPPTPRSRTPLEEAKRRNTLSAAEFEAAAQGRPPYPSTPPSDTVDQNPDYMTYHPRSSGHSVDELPSSLRPGPTTRPAANYQKPHFNAVEIGSSDSVPLPPVQSRSRANTASTPRPPSAASQRPPVRRPPGKEDPYDFLKEFHTVFVVDDSASMDGGDLARWNETRRALEVVADVATRYDASGIDIRFLNNTSYDAYSVTSPSAIRKLFALVQPEGCTPTGRVLDEILRDYIDTYVRSKRPSYTNDISSSPTSGSDISSSQAFRPQVKPLNIVVLTDGEPTDDPESVIVDAARQLERLNAPLHQVGIQFFQIGDEPGAREALQELDDALAGVYNIRDMVDTTPFSGEEVTGEVILKVLLGGVNRRVDRRKN